MVLMAVVLASCAGDEPDGGVKPDAKRRVLLLNGDGTIYDGNGVKVAQLPHCVNATNIISDGDDYFVAGIHDELREGYWKNGHWNTLHVDFPDDVDRWIDGIAKWDSYIFLYDHPHVLKNSGIFSLDDGERFLPGRQALAVSEGRCYVVGSKLTDDSAYDYVPVLYYEHKGRYTFELLPMPAGVHTGTCTCVYAHDRTHTLVGGYVGKRPAVWVDTQLHTLPIPYYRPDQDMIQGEVTSVAMCGDAVLAVGVAKDEAGRSVAMMWHDGEYDILSSGDSAMETEAVEVLVYGDDVYVLTREFGTPARRDVLVINTLLWKNGEPVKRFDGMDFCNFTVL